MKVHPHIFHPLLESSLMLNPPGCTRICRRLDQGEERGNGGVRGDSPGQGSARPTVGTS